MTATSLRTDKFVLYQVILRTFARRAQGVSSPLLRRATGLALLAVGAVFVKYGLYDQLAGLFALFSAGLAPGRQLALAFLVTGVSGAALGCVQLAFSPVAIRQPSEAVVALPIKASLWHEVNVNIYVALAWGMQAVVAVAVLVAAVNQLTLGLEQLVCLAVILAASTLVLAQLLRLLLLFSQGLDAAPRARLVLVVCIGAVLGIILAHAFRMDLSLTGRLALLVIQSPIAVSTLTLAALAAITWAGRQVSARVSHWHQRQGLRLAIATPQSAASPRLAKSIPPLTWASILVMLRDRSALFLVSSGLGMLATVTAAARYFHNTSGVSFTILFSPYLYAMLASIWMSRSRANIGRGRLDIYALPILPWSLVVQQGLALSLLLSLGGILLAAGQSLYLGQPLALTALLQQLALFIPLFCCYYLVSCIFARNSRNFTVNGLIDVITMAVTFMVIAVNQYLLQHTRTGTLLAASCTLAAVPLALALLNERRLVAGSA